ncbi:MAG: dTDP-glucose 4,6-dehydratase [Sulfuricaulis sp.]
MDTIIITGGAGFIGSNFALDWVVKTGGSIVNLDKLTYAGNLGNLDTIRHDPRHIFVKGDIADRELVHQLLTQHRPWAVINFAAESHVDRSIHAPRDFIDTNVTGTFCLLEEVRAYWQAQSENDKKKFRFLQISTDEVYGSLEPQDPAFTELSPYAPNSPYAASKAAADHLVRAYHHTYGLPAITTNCSNNFGPYQFPEKLIPLVILNALDGKSLPIYGDGLNVRDWLYVQDHCEAIRLVLTTGAIGQTYNIGANNELTNLELVHAICEILDELRPRSPDAGYASLITFVKDRPGHDRRYAIDASRIRRELGWTISHAFAARIRETVRWYLEHLGWVKQVTSGEYRQWVDLNYGGRQTI